MHSSVVLHSFCDFVSLFPLSLKGGISFCVVASYGHVSLIVESARLAELPISLVHCCGVVVRSLVSRSKPENCHRACCHLIDSHRHRSVHTRGVDLVETTKFSNASSSPKTSLSRITKKHPMGTQFLIEMTCSTSNPAVMPFARRDTVLPEKRGKDAVAALAADFCLETPLGANSSLGTRCTRTGNR